MKILAAVLLLASLCAAQELRRPTVDVNAGALTALGCVGTNQVSAAMLASYDSAGQATASPQNEAGSFGVSTTFYKTRMFKTWAPASAVYSTLTLNINAGSAGNDGDLPASVRLSYSINGGSTWTQIFNDNGVLVPQQTYSIVLGSTQDLSLLRVGVCAQATSVKTGGLQPGDDRIVVWDIWTLGQNSATPPVGTGSSAGARHNAVIVN